ncbi:MAG: rhomboid family intramembrane serine protease [Gammaproteobacteria bacterium]
MTLSAGGSTAPRPEPAVATLTFVGLLLLVFAVQLRLVPGALFLPSGLAFIPGALFGGADLPALGPGLPPPATLVTYQFLHAGWVHLLGNLAFLAVFAPRVERTLGHGRFTVLLLVCGIGAALAQSWPDPASPVAMIGASGAISGVLGAYLVLHPRAEIRVALPGIGPLLQLPAWVILTAWFCVQLLYTNLSEAPSGGIAFRAHVGGFTCGLLLAAVLHFLALLSADARTVARTLRSRDSSH